MKLTAAVVDLRQNGTGGKMQETSIYSDDKFFEFPSAAAWWKDW
jgi:hypothetical protein